MAEQLRIRRRRTRGNPMRTRRVGTALYATSAGAVPADFPGLDLDGADNSRSRTLSGGLSLLIHGALLAALLLAAYLAPVEEIEELIQLQRIEDVQNDPAPAPRVVQERATPVFDPSAMAVVPQVVNPVVIRQAAPVVKAPKLDVETVNTVRAPQEIARAVTVVTQARAYQSPVVVSANPVRVEGTAPAIRGPVEHVAPVGVQSGPRKVASVGGAGVGDPQALGSGSAVRDGIVSGRDVLGAKTGARAQVHWAVGDSNMRGRGGSGSGPGGVGFEDCMARSDVNQYLARVKDRMYKRWTLPADIAPDLAVVLRFSLDPAGTAARVELVSAPDGRLGESAVTALRSASPFDPMSDRVRCLAGSPLIATFRNPRTAAN